MHTLYLFRVLRMRNEALDKDSSKDSNRMLGEG